MKLAPIGAFGGMAFTIGKYGLSTLIPLGKLMICVYATMALFVFIVLNFICKLYKFSLWKYLAHIKEELLIVLGTSSSESVLPRMMTKMEDFGCSKPVVGLVIPTGYSFNLDGTTIYLSMATIFLAQVFHVDLSLGQQLTIIAILLVTSKGSDRSNRWRLYCTSVYFICDECYSIRRVSAITWCRSFHVRSTCYRQFNW